MIVFGTSNIGPLKYLLSFEKSIKEKVIWIANKKTKKILKDRKIVKLKDLKYYKIQLVITGTSYKFKIDKKLILFAKNKKIKSISFIEHWGLYYRRFRYKNTLLLPDKILVNDKIAKHDCIKEGLPKEKIVIGGNPRLEEIVIKINNIKYKKNNISNLNKKYYKIGTEKKILFISEHLKNLQKNSSDYLGYSEFEVLNSIINNVKKTNIIFIKLHPSEDVKKYKKYINQKNIFIDKSFDMIEIIKSYDIIIGMGSMLLLELSIYDKPIFSFRPNYTKQFIGDRFINIQEINNINENKLYYSKNLVEKNIKLENFLGSKNKILKIIKNFIK